MTSLLNKAEFPYLTEEYSIYTNTGAVSLYGEYLQDGRSGIESQWWRDFPQPSTWVLGPTQLLYNGYRVFSGGKTAGA